MNPQSQIQAMVDRETAAWNSLDADALVDLFHPDTVWPWPPHPRAHDPMDWVMPMGKFDRLRWRASWQALFSTHELIHNQRQTVKIQVSEQADGALAVVDVDTLWRHKETGAPSHWLGRACKVYTWTGSRWYFLFQTGLLDYQGGDDAQRIPA